MAPAQSKLGSNVWLGRAYQIVGIIIEEGILSAKFAPAHFWLAKQIYKYNIIYIMHMFVYWSNTVLIFFNNNKTADKCQQYSSSYYLLLSLLLFYK